MKLTLKEIVELNFELNGVTRRTIDGKEEVVTKGLVKQKMSLKIKVYLQRLNNIVAEEIKIYEGIKKELFEKFGDGKTIPAENIDLANQELAEALSLEKNIDVVNLWSSSLSFDDLSVIETDEHYPVFYKLLDNQ